MKKDLVSSVFPISMMLKSYHWLFQATNNLATSIRHYAKEISQSQDKYCMFSTYMRYPKSSQTHRNRGKIVVAKAGRWKRKQEVAVQWLHKVSVMEISSRIRNLLYSTLPIVNNTINLLKKKIKRWISC